MRITKAEWKRWGGLKNPRLYREFKANRGWLYYATEGYENWVPTATISQR